MTDASLLAMTSLSHYVLALPAPTMLTALGYALCALFWLVVLSGRLTPASFHFIGWGHPTKGGRS